MIAPYIWATMSDRYIFRTALFCILFFFVGNILHGQAGTITVGGLVRNYTLRLPSAYDGITPLPLVIAMHGGFGSGTQLENQSQLTVKAEQEGFIMVYPDGTGTIRTWNAGGCCGYAMNNNIDDVGSSMPCWMNLSRTTRSTPPASTPLA